MSATPVKNPKSLTGAQRRELRALGHHLKPVVQIGLKGVTPALVAATAHALELHEVIKISIGSEAPVDRKEAPAELAEATGAHVAGVVGRTAILYRRRFDNPVVKVPGAVEVAERPASETPAAPTAKGAISKAAARRGVRPALTSGSEPADDAHRPSRPGPGLLAAQRAAAERAALAARATADLDDDEDFDDEDFGDDEAFDDDESLGSDEQ